MHLNKYKEAIDNYLTTMELDGPDAFCHCNIGECYEQMEEFTEARNHYKKAVQLLPQLDEAWFGLGICYDNEDKMIEAQHYYKRALDIDPLNAEYWFAYADVLFALGLIHECEKAFEQATSINPNLHEAWLDWSAVKYDNGEQESAITMLLDRIEENHTVIQYYYRVAGYLYKNGMQKEGLAFFDTAVLRNFDEHTAFFDFFPDLLQNQKFLEILDNHNPRNN